MKTKKYKEVLSLYEKTSTEVSKSPKDWLTFLDSACNNYKLRFDEQLLIYAQRPDATAVLELNRWNRNFGRWVKSGTKGIAVFGDAPKGNGTLKYYFDISDTRETDHSRKVTIWEIQPEYNNNIIKSLENSFGYLSEKSNIFDAVISAVKNISENILANNTQRQLIYATENSLLEELSDDIVIAQYTELVRNSAAYMTAKRLRLDTNERFFQDDFVNIINFLSEKYALEDKIIKFYPQEIARLKQRITALENDIITVNNNVVQEKDAFSPMTLEGIDYTKKAVAGQMLLTACKEHAFEEPTEIGSYRGFRMEVSYSILTSEYRLDLCGNLRHQVTLGTDIFGNITRIDNELAKIPAKLEAAKHVLTETLEQYDYAKEQVKKPFASEADLQKKTNRLNELNAFLNIEKAVPKSNSSSDGIEYKFRKCSEAEKDILVDNGFSDYRYSESDNKYIFRYPAEQEMKINAALNIRQNNIKI